MKVKQILKFSIGPMVTAIISLITLPILTWIFTAEDIGRISLLQVVISFFMLFFTLGTDQTYIRFYHESRNKIGLFTSVLSPSLISLTLFILLFYFFDFSLSDLIFDIKSPTLSMIVIVCIYATLLTRYLLSILRMEEKGGLFSLSKIVDKFIYLAIIISFILFGLNVDFYHLILSKMLSCLISLFLLIWFTRHILIGMFMTKFNYMEIVRVLKFGFPLIWSGLAFWGLTALDRIFLKELSSLNELAIYSVSVSFAGVAIIFQSVFSVVWAPTVYKWASENNNCDKVEIVTNYVLIIVVIMFCLLGLLSWIIPKFLPSTYYSIQWITVSCLGYPLLYTLSECTVVGIGISKKTVYAMLSSLGALLFNVLGNYFLIPTHGAAGAAISTCLSFYIFFILRTEFSMYLWKPFKRSRLYIFTSICVFGSTVMALCGNELNVILRFYWIVVFIYLITTFRKEFTDAIVYCKSNQFYK